MKGSPMKAVIIYISVIVAATFWLSLYIAGFRISAVFLAGGLGSLLLLRPIGKTKDETLRSLKTVLYAAAVTLGCFLFLNLSCTAFRPQPQDIQPKPPLKCICAPSDPFSAERN
jgi:hypothetical protein